MYTFVIIVGLSLLIGASLGLRSKSLGVLCGAFFGSAISFIFTMALQRFCPKVWVDSGVQQIIAMRDGSQTEGNFFLGSGQLEGKDYFFCYRKAVNGGLVRVKFAANHTVIYEDASSPNEGRVETTKLAPNGDWEKFVLPLDQPVFSYAIHVPPGTVVRQFAADLR